MQLGGGPKFPEVGAEPDIDVGDAYARMGLVALVVLGVAVLLIWRWRMRAKARE